MKNSLSSSRNHSGDATYATAVMIMGFLGVLIIVVLLFGIAWLTDSLGGRHISPPSIDGTYAKITEVKKHVTMPCGRVYEVTIDLGYGQIREATLTGYSPHASPKVKDVILVASKDGRYYYNRFFGETWGDIITIRPTVAWL